MEKAEQRLSSLGKLSQRYQQALAKGYWSIGREYLYSNYSNSESDKYRYYAAILEKIMTLYPQLFSEDKSNWYKIFLRFFGYRITEKLSYLFYQRKTSPIEKIKLLITNY
jgi:hypothetical protein